MLVNETNGNVLASDVRYANTFWGRFRGLMFEPELPRGTALQIDPCRSIHTWFMRFPIDVLYLDRGYMVVGIEERLGPRRIGRVIGSAVSVVELPAGTVSETATEIGQTVKFDQQNQKQC